MSAAANGERLNVCPQFPHCQSYRLARTNWVPNASGMMMSIGINALTSASTLVFHYALPHPG